MFVCIGSFSFSFFLFPDVVDWIVQKSLGDITRRSLDKMAFVESSKHKQRPLQSSIPRLEQVINFLFNYSLFLCVTGF